MLLQETTIAIVNMEVLFTIARRFVIVGNTKLELLDERIIYTNGCFKRVRRWYKGAHPKLGLIIKGLTGQETVVEQDVIVPIGRIHVVDSPPNPLL